MWSQPNLSGMIWWGKVCFIIKVYSRVTTRPASAIKAEKVDTSSTPETSNHGLTGKPHASAIFELSCLIHRIHHHNHVPTIDVLSFDSKPLGQELGIILEFQYFNIAVEGNKANQIHLS